MTAARKMDLEPLPFCPPELAPIDDEPETEEEEALVAEARASVARGDVLTLEEAKRSFGLP